MKLAAEDQTVHIVRGLLCYVWQASGATGNVVEGSETTGWTRELVGTIHLKEMTSSNVFLDELICHIWQAVVGTSRLPLTSLEAPLPAFALGQVAFSYTGGRSSDALIHWSVLLTPAYYPTYRFAREPSCLKPFCAPLLRMRFPKSSANF